MADELKARAGVVIGALKRLSAAHGLAPDVVASTSKEAAALIEELVAQTEGTSK